jgi:hypothetical protein
MCRRRTLALTPRRRSALARVRDHHPKPYLREKAAALLKVADGWPVQDVARYGLLRPRSPNTVAAWLDRYAQRGLAGLRVRPGRGRQPAFSPRRAEPPPRPGGPG